jgi:hypothetical protein
VGGCGLAHGDIREYAALDLVVQGAFLAGSILSFLAATFPAMPTGFWDRKPKGNLARIPKPVAVA